MWTIRYVFGPRSLFAGADRYFFLYLHAVGVLSRMGQPFYPNSCPAQSTGTAPTDVGTGRRTRLRQGDKRLGAAGQCRIPPLPSFPEQVKMPP